MQCIRRVILALAVLGMSVAAHASTIAEFTNTSGSLTELALGQSVTISSGGPWDTIAFNFFAADLTPTANGTLFLLDREYFGMPSALTTSTPGFIAQSTSVVGGIYVFDPSVVLNPLTQYFFYTNRNLFAAGGNGYAGGQLYSSADDSAFHQEASSDAAFRLTGTEVTDAVPEPATLSLIGLGIAGIAAHRQRQRGRS